MSNNDIERDDLFDLAPTLLKEALPCPFCGYPTPLLVTWTDDGGDYPALECPRCYGSAPAVTWNRREWDGKSK